VLKFFRPWRKDLIHKWSMESNIPSPSLIKNNKLLYWLISAFLFLKASNQFHTQDNFHSIKAFLLQASHRYHTLSFLLKLPKLKHLLTSNSDLSLPFQAKIKLNGSLFVQLKCVHFNGEKNWIKQLNSSVIFNKVDLTNLRIIWKTRRSKKPWNMINLVKWNL
jgi:hypothetical protein